MSCNGTVNSVYIRAALYRNHVKVSDTGGVYKGSTAWAQTNAAIGCKNGLYQGWGGAQFISPPGYSPPSGSSYGWGPEAYITC
jgi:hypothetical protein